VGVKKRLHKFLISTPHVSAWPIWRAGCFLIEKRVYSSVSQPLDRGPVPGPGVNHTRPREAWGNYNMLQDFISPDKK